ncbi:unnamed protein product [Diamesa serratosioi]
MVRKCCVDECLETDLTILSHRFPKSKIAGEWQHALNLTKYDADSLKKSYVVCTKHFMNKAYRNSVSNFLNSTAIPNLKVNHCNTRIHTEILPKCTEFYSKLPKKKRKLKDEYDDVTESSSVQEFYVGIDEIRTEEQENQETIRCLSENGSELEVVVYTKCWNSDGPESQNLKTPRVVKNVVKKAKDKIEEIIPQESSQELIEVTNVYETPEELAVDDQILEKLTECVYIHRDSQTDVQLVDSPVESIPIMQTPIDPDEKFIATVYPEYQNKSKMELIEMILENNRKIEALDSKVKKFELAIKNLL